MGEHVGDVDTWVLLAPLTFRPVRGLGLKLYAGPGVESKLSEANEEPPPGEEGSQSTDAADQGREALFVFRTGMAWAFELGRLSLTPQVELDFTRESGRWETGVVFGVAVGLGF